MINRHLLVGAFSELAASLNMQGIKLAPTSVWQAMPYAVPRTSNVTFPQGELSPAASTGIRELARIRRLEG